MASQSIVLGLDGSKFSRYAAELTWRMARQLDCEVTACHVVDTANAWEFIGHDHPGFVEGQAYKDAYTTLGLSLTSLGQNLLDAYSVEATAQGITGRAILESGSPVPQLCEAAATAGFVVIGHRPYSNQDTKVRRPFMRLSNAEALAHDCRKPLLVVQGPCPQWTEMTIMLSLDHINESYINACLDFAATLGLSPSVVCLDPSGDNLSEDFAKDLRQANPRLANVPVAVTAVEHEVLCADVQWDGVVSKPEWSKWASTLMVIPTREIGGQRITVVGSSPSLFIRYLTAPCTLLWPEEQTIA